MTEKERAALREAAEKLSEHIDEDASYDWRVKVIPHEGLVPMLIVECLGPTKPHLPETWCGFRVWAASSWRPA